MFRWATLTVDLAASVFFVEYRIYGRWPNFLRLIISLAVETVTFFILSAIRPDIAFPCAMLAGQLTCLGFDFFFSGRRILLPEACLYLGGTASFFPLCLDSDPADWQYALYQAIFILCLAITPMSMGRNKKNESQTYDLRHENRPAYWLIVCLPCTVLLPEALLFAVGKEMSGLVMSTILLLFSALLLMMQREVFRRLYAEYLNLAMSRWQRESRDYMNTIRSQRHDYNLHLHAVSGLLGSGRYAECQEYVKKLVSQANDVNDIMPVSDPVVGSMLYNMREEARKQGTDILYHITYDMEDVLCNGFECNKIIGNLLQNAMDALQTPEDKKYGIQLSILKRRGNTVIISENRFTGDPDYIARVFEPGYSTKKGHEGIGLSMVLRTARRYGGHVYPEFEPDRIRFVVNIPNKVNLQKGTRNL